MGKGRRLKALRHPQRIRTRTDEEVESVMIAYKNLFKSDPFTANLMLLCSELSEYEPVPMEDEDESRAFIKANHKRLVNLFLRRFGSIDEYVLKNCNEYNVIGGYRILWVS
jgi:hypothetical protein